MKLLRFIGLSVLLRLFHNAEGRNELLHLEISTICKKIVKVFLCASDMVDNPQTQPFPLTTHAFYLGGGGFSYPTEVISLGRNRTATLDLRGKQVHSLPLLESRKIANRRMNLEMRTPGSVIMTPPQRPKPAQSIRHFSHSRTKFLNEAILI